MWKNIALWVWLLWCADTITGECNKHSFQHIPELDHYYTYYPDIYTKILDLMECAFFCSRDKNCRMFSMRSVGCHFYYFYYYKNFYGKALNPSINYIRMGTCLNGYSTVDKTCMKLISSDQAMTDAVQTCVEQNALLLKAYTSSQATLIKEFIESSGATAAAYWIHCDEITDRCKLKLTESRGIKINVKMSTCQDAGTGSCYTVDVSKTAPCLRRESCNATFPFVCEHMPFV